MDTQRTPSDLLRRFVLDFMVEQALKRNVEVDGRSRNALAASFSIEPLVNVGNVRKYRVIASESGENRRVYQFLFERACHDRAFRTTELCYRRCVTVLRDGDLGVAPRERDILVPEHLVRHRAYDKVGFILTEVGDVQVEQIPQLEGARVADIPKVMRTLGIVEVYPAGTVQQSQGGRSSSALRRTVQGHRTRRGIPTGNVSVSDWIKRAYTDTFGQPPVHVSKVSEEGPLYVVRVLAITDRHEAWVLEVTRHLRIREGKLRLEVRLLDVR